MGKCNTFFVGLDIDDNRFHATLLNSSTKETFRFACKPTLGALVKRLDQFKSKQNVKVRICYEASYIGFSLCRNLNALSYHCDIIAPSLIPKKAGKKVKTDKLDASELAELLSKEMLTAIHVPNEEDEQVRDLIRTRNFMKKQHSDTKRHILSLCRRNEMHYQTETKSKNHWTVRHMAWLKSKVNKLKSANTKSAFARLFLTLEQQRLGLDGIEHEIEEISKTPRYREKVAALCCLRGIKILTAMSLITEIGDIRRFPHPNNLVSYAGMDIKEHSSGGREKKAGITKMGNRRIRTAIVEAAQSATKKPAISRRLKAARQNQNPEVIAVADRCMQRLYTKSCRLLFNNKTPNKVKTAAGREMLCFVWEILQMLS